MDSRNEDPYERARFAAGIKTAAIVVILGAVAVMADHAFFIAPRGSAPANVGATVSTAPAIEGVNLPDNLRPHAGDVQPPPPSF